MTTAPVGDLYYEHHHSPPVSPKSLPHGTKRRASDDDVEVQNQFSNTFKRLRLSRLHDARSRRSTDACIEDGQKLNPQHFAPSGVSLRDASAISDSPLSYPTPVSGPIGSPASRPTSTTDDDFMTVDETADRVFVRDLDLEIAEIEAEEARRSQGIKLTRAAEEYSKIPDHLLKQSPDRPELAMQLVLYRDPTSISVSEEHDAVRRAIMAARQRMRDKQAAEHDNGAALDLGQGVGGTVESNSIREEVDDQMEID